MIDQARVLANTAVNLVEAIPNTVIDLVNATRAANIAGYTQAKTADELGTTPPPQTLRAASETPPELPRVELPVRSDYRSEMMRRDDTGKVVETGVTLAAPLVVGMAMKPNVPMSAFAFFSRKRLFANRFANIQISFERGR